jgi:hypothetical protein
MTTTSRCQYRCSAMFQSAGCPPDRDGDAAGDAAWLSARPAACLACEQCGLRPGLRQDIRSEALHVREVTMRLGIQHEVRHEQRCEQRLREVNESSAASSRAGGGAYLSSPAAGMFRVFLEHTVSAEMSRKPALRGRLRVHQRVQRFQTELLGLRAPGLFRVQLAQSPAGSLRAGGCAYLSSPATGSRVYQLA